MPTYEYACKDCGEHLEVVQSFKDDPLTECPACGGPLRKVFGSIGISFKGSGFYRTDSRAPARAERKSESKVDSTKPESAKTESAKTESAKTESAKTESAKTGSAKTGSAKAGSGGAKSAAAGSGDARSSEKSA